MYMRFFLLGFVGNHTFSCKQHTSDRRRIFQCYPGNLCRIDNACFEQIFIHFSTCIESKISLSFFHFLHNDATLNTTVNNNLAKRFFNGTFYDLNTCGFIFIDTFQVFKRFNGADKRNASTGNNSFFNCGSCSMQGIINTVFFSFISTSVAAPT